MQITLGDNQQTTLHLSGLDNAGLAGSFVKPPVWAIADPSIATITPDATGLTAILASASPPKLGTTTLTITDADDATVAALVATVEVQAEPVSHLAITVDTPVEKVAAAAAKAG